MTKKQKPLAGSTDQKVADESSRVDGEDLDQDRVSQLAREMWIERGMPEGVDDEIWLEAERRLRHPSRAEDRISPPGSGNVNQAR